MEKGRLKLSFGGVWAGQADGVGWADRFTKKIHKNDLQMRPIKVVVKMRFAKMIHKMTLTKIFT